MKHEFSMRKYEDMGDFYDKWEEIDNCGDVPLWKALVDTSYGKPRRFRTAQDCAIAIRDRTLQANLILKERYEREHRETKRHPLATD